MSIYFLFGPKNKLLTIYALGGPAYLLRRRLHIHFLEAFSRYSVVLLVPRLYVLLFIISTVLLFDLVASSLAVARPLAVSQLVGAVQLDERLQLARHDVLVRYFVLRDTPRRQALQARLFGLVATQHRLN